MKQVLTFAIAALTAITLTAQSESIRINQVAFYPQQSKIAVIEGSKAKKMTIKNTADGKRVGKAKALRTNTSPWSNKKRTIVEITGITTPGTYELSVDGHKTRFDVQPHALNNITRAALKAFYLNRSGIAIDGKYAGVYARPLGHPDTKVMIHPSAVSPGRPAGTIISSPLGWYDAGDYNKYIVNSSYSVGLMLMAYEQNKEYFNRLNADIPESGNSTADLLDELMFNLKWMITMQDPYDGGVYHKLTTPNFEDFVMPTDCHQQRYVVQKSVTASYDFAAVMALAARIYKGNKDYPAFAEQAQKAALAAYHWAELNPEAVYDQDKMNMEFDPDVTTGTYGDNDASDEHLWAATELFLLTGDEFFLKAAQPLRERGFSQPGWGNVTGLAMYSWITCGDDKTGMHDLMLNKLLGFCDYQLSTLKASSFNTPAGNHANDYGWGCLSECFCTSGLAHLYCYRATGDKKYLEAALHNADYVLGRNATGYCYVTGYGHKPPMNIHHRISSADGIDAPIPGLIAGGPNPGQQDNGDGSLPYPSRQPDESYIDATGSYASNEIAINWNASLVSLLGWIDAEMK